MTFIKSEYIDIVDDQSSPPEQILFEHEFTKNWLSENLNGVYYRINSTYEKKSLFDKETNITLQKTDNGWILSKKPKHINETKMIYGKTLSKVDHPGLFNFKSNDMMSHTAKWMERMTEDTYETDNLDNYSPINNRHIFKL